MRYELDFWDVLVFLVGFLVVVVGLAGRVFSWW